MRIYHDARSCECHKKKRVTGTLREDLCTFIIISRRILLRMRNVSDEIWRENQNTHFVLNIFFPPKIVPFIGYCGKILWARQATDDKIIRRMRLACWMTMARHVPEIRNSIAFPRQEWLRERASVLRYTYIVCLVSLVTDLLCCSR